MVTTMTLPSAAKADPSTRLPLPQSKESPWTNTNTGYGAAGDFESGAKKESTVIIIWQSTL